MQHIDKLRQAAQQALEALESCREGDYTTGHVIHPSFDEKACAAAEAALRAALAEQRSDGMPNGSDERHLRRLLAVRVGMPNTYYDDGEAHGVEHGITIDFMREPVADIDAKLRALNVARAVTAPQPAKREPLSGR